MSIYQTIEELIAYGIIHLKLAPENIIYIRNQIYHLLDLHHPTVEKIDYKKIYALEEPYPLLCKLYSQLKNKTIDFQKFSSQIMDQLIPRPKEVIDYFYSLDTKAKTDYFYNLAIKSYYIRKNEIDKNIIWEYPNLIITINLSKPEIIQKNKQKKNI